MLGPISGAHFNPAVTMVFRFRGEIATGLALAFVVVQIAGGIAGVWAAHMMFEETLLQFSAKSRTGGAQWFAEAVATFGLVFTILATLKARAEAVPLAVGLYITAAYWFTASTSFANPAVTIARSLSDTFAGISPAHMPGFILAQLAGAMVGLLVCRWLLRD
jgi:glycerol uptake facilitator-like aquaporin